MKSTHLAVAILLLSSVGIYLWVGTSSDPAPSQTSEDARLEEVRRPDQKAVAPKVSRGLAPAVSGVAKVIPPTGASGNTAGTHQDLPPPSKDAGLAATGPAKELPPPLSPEKVQSFRASYQQMRAKEDAFIRQELGLKEDEIQRLKEVQTTMAKRISDAAAAKETGDRIRALIAERDQQVAGIMGEQGAARYVEFKRKNAMEMSKILRSPASNQAPTGETVPVQAPAGH